jgi:uncharacterized membrane protein YfcA
MTLSQILLLVGAAFIAGIMNAVAGGGSFLTFPALVFAGIPSVMANATSTVALFPASFASAWAYRRDFPRIEGLSTSVLLVISVAGGIIGALLLIYTPERTFDAIVPWLLLAATLLFAVNKRLIPWLKRNVHVGPLALSGVQFGIAVYGGYFGGAIGIMMLALFGLLGVTHIHAANALKTLMAGALNAVAVVCFIVAGKVDWLPAAIMVLSAVAGGYVGARVARRMNPDHIRASVIVIGVAMTVVFFVRG